MSDGHTYPDHFYADALNAVRAHTGKPTGAYRPTDPVTKPAHYQRAGIETIDYIRATLDAAGFEAYCIGNVLKYVSRYREKGGVEDLRKAQVYLGWAIDPVKPENAAAVREAKVAYDMACDASKGSVVIHEPGVAPPGGWTPYQERMPKWDVRWGKDEAGKGLHPMNGEAKRHADEFNRDDNASGV